MSMSLRDQLLQAGLVSEKQAREAERQQQQQQQGRQRLPKPQRAAPSAQELAARKAQQAKAARDAQLNRQQHDKAERKARQAQIRQLIEQNRLPKPEADQYYNFVDGRKIRRIAADAALRERLARGEIAIVRYDAGYQWVPAATAARIRERDARAVVADGVSGAAMAPGAAAADATAETAAAGAAGATAGLDDGYQAFVVPDDLIW
jgi:uncharacterized protein YaiL (DUF2058 family)